MQGARYEVVVSHFNCLATPQLRKNRAALVANQNKVNTKFSLKQFEVFSKDEDSPNLLIVCN